MGTADISAIEATWPKQSIPKGQVGFDQSVEKGYISPYSGDNPSDCAKAGKTVNPSAYTSNAGFLGGFLSGGGLRAGISSAITTGLNFIPVIGPMLSQVFAKINPFAHHDQAVVREQSTLCSVVPAVNAQLAEYDRQVRVGEISVQEYDADLAGVKAQYLDAVRPIYQTCNAACYVGFFLDGVIQRKKQENASTSPLYYVKKYWYIPVIAFVVWIVIKLRRV